MSISDIITVVALILAIIAILNEKNRKHLLLKFHLVDYIIFGIAFILINYFVFYESFFSYHIVIKALYFKNFGFRNPHHYAYIITIAAVSYLFYKIWFSFYPRTNLQKVLNFYRIQIEQQEVSFLLDLLERYHLDDIIKQIASSEDYNPDEDWWMHRFEKKTAKEKIREKFISSIQYLFPSSTFNRELYATYVLNNVLDDPAFTILSANQRPYFFASLFKSFRKNKRDAFPHDMMKAYLREWINNKNFWLQKELRQSQNFDSGQPSYFFEQNRILGAIMGHLDVSDVNELWQPFGEAAREELEEERLEGYDSKMFLEFREDHHLWEFKTYIAIEFFFILIIEAIRAKYRDSHFFLHNYWYITNEITKTLEEYPPKQPDVQTVYHAFIDKIISKAFHWLHLCNKYEHPGMFHDVLRCIGNIISDLTKCVAIPEKNKIRIVESLLDAYCSYEQNGQTNAIRKKMGEILFEPSMTIKPADPYYGILAKAWEKFDKVPFRHLDQDLPVLSELKQQVIIPLGLNPDEY